ncbi:hypothetical protein [Streptomyces sp. NPDC093591]|uniref:hypothetical protein n=1 Tax=Streptomyces sp. NPDC093591 TaxID=3366044 RepID=UPI00380C0E9A
MNPSTPYRYGVFLRPDPTTCALLAQLHLLMKQQYGLVSCAAFPPHATLAGSMHTLADPTEVADRVGEALRGTRQFTVYNSGFEQGTQGVSYNVHDLPDGTVNRPMADLILTAHKAFDGISLPPDHFPFIDIEPAEFRAHLSVVAHEMLLRPDLLPEVTEFVERLGWQPPASFTAETVSLFRFHSPDWQGHWWTTLTWEHVRSWTLETAAG